MFRIAGEGGKSRMIAYEMLSKVGERKQNEDTVGTAEREGRYCFVLADGLGGHGGGAEASGLVTDCILESFRESGEVSCEYLEHCFWESQDLLMQEQQNQGRMNEMKTTLVVLLVDENKVIWGHIGDSRLYYFKQKRLQERTLDHSVPQMLVASGEITEKEIRGHADRNRLLRVMGTEWESPRYQIAQPMEREGQQEFLLCTDGFWELIEERHMSHMLKKSKTPEAWLTSMEQLVLKHGKDKEMDNYSAIAVFLEQ